jgi:DNA-binding NtrC family response regulator
MERSLQLTAAEREFFALVAEAAFANPFSDARAEIDLKITGARRHLTPAERLELLIPTVRGRLRGFESSGRAHVQAYAGEDHELVETVFLFDTYYRCHLDLDRLIAEQERAGDEPCRVEFAPQVLARLRELGFRESEACRHFALLYQLRRAYYFIAGGLLGKSRSMKDLRLHLWNNVVTHSIRRYARHLLGRMEDFSTLLLGETGAGKGAAAAAIGRSGWIPVDSQKQRFVESFTKAFVAINLSQYAEALIESELFGHRKGAFTGAVEGHEGVFARCSPHGAIFLDEIGEVSVPVQIKLLQVLQDRVFHPVGSHERRRFHGRVVAATNRPLDDLRQEGGFRRDFYYRLCSDVVAVPPLRVRLAEEPAELEALVGHLVSRLAGESSPDLAEHVIAVIRRSVPAGYAWPGNVRELEQCVRRILITDRYDADLGESALDARASLREAMSTGALTVEELLVAYCALLRERHGSYSDAARKAGIDRRTVRRYAETWHRRQAEATGGRPASPIAKGPRRRAR